MAIAFWIADGGPYITEARHSASTVAEHMPDLGRVLFATDNPEKGGEFHDIIPLPERRHDFWFQDAARYMVQATQELLSDRALYLDTDTHLCLPIYDMMELLDRCELVGAFAPGRQTTQTVDYVPDAFPELNIGVLAMNLTDNRMRRFWRIVYNNYCANSERYRNNDQGPLREALWNTNVRLGIVPPEYNCRWGFGGFHKYPVRVLHGRGDYEAVCKVLSTKGDMRTWARGQL